LTATRHRVRNAVVSRAADGEFLLNLSVGPPDAAPEDFTYLEFPLSRDDARALRDALG
jgi:hypothetical protein